MKFFFGGGYNYSICQVIFILIMLQFLSPLISVSINIFDVICSLVTSNNLICSHTRQST